MSNLFRSKHLKALRDNYRPAFGVAIFLLLSFVGNAQVFPPPSTAYGTRVNRIAIDSVLYGPTGCGAPTDSTFLFSQGFGQGQKLRKFALYYDSCGHHAYIWDPSLQAWHTADSSGGGGGSDSGFQVLQATVAGAPIAKYVDGSGHRFILYDTLASHPAAITTSAGAQKKIDSISNVINVLLAAKFGLSDTGYTHILASVFTLAKVRDSLAAAYTAALGTKFSAADTGYTHILASIFLLQKVNDSMKLVNDARYKQIADSNRTIASYASVGRLNKTADSIAALILSGGADSGFAVQIGQNTTAVPLQKYIDGSGHRYIRGDTSVTNPGAITTQSSRQKLSDSLNILIGQKVANAAGVSFLGYGPYASKPGSGTGIWYASDSSKFYYVSSGTATDMTPTFNLFFHNSGHRGDSLAIVAGGNTVVFPKFIDSAGLCLHHIVNADSTWTWYVDSACMVTWAHLRKTLDSISYIYLTKANNLSDVPNAGTARTNLGLGTSATHDVPASGNASTTQVVIGSDTRLSGGSSTTVQGANGIKVTTVGSTATVGGDSLVNKSRSDLGHLPRIRQLVYSNGVRASGTLVANYPATAIDSNTSMLSATQLGGASYGGVVWLNSGAGDSILITLPFGVVFGDSQAAGHSAGGVGHIGRLETNPYNYQYPDSPGQISYQMRLYTNMRWYNQGYGGETSTAGRERWDRDVLGDSAIVTGVYATVGARSLSRKPNIVIIIEGINDVYAGVSAGVIEANLEYFAASCQQNNIRCVMLNLPGYGIISEAMRNVIVTVNRWLADGALDKYGAVIVDYNSFWNGVFVNGVGDNIDHSAYIGTDEIHPIPAGYDTLAGITFHSAHIPVMDTLIVTAVNSSTSPVTGLNTPTAITLNGVPCTLSGSISKCPISSYMPDSVWLKTTSVSGSGTQYGYSSGIAALLENDVNSTDSEYTRRTLNSNGATNPDPSFSSATIIAKNSNNGSLLLNMIAGDNATKVFQVTSDQAMVGRMFLNRTAVINANDRMAITGGFSADSYISASGTTGNRIGPFQIGNTATASTLARGINWFNNAMNFEMYVGDIFNFSVQSGSAWTGGVGNNLNIGYINDTIHVGNIGNADTIAMFKASPYINNLATLTTHGFIGTYFSDNRNINLGNNTGFGFWNITSSNFFNSSSGNTVVGSSTDNGLDKMQVNGNLLVADSVKTPGLPHKSTLAGTDSLLARDASGNQFVAPQSAIGGGSNYQTVQLNSGSLTTRAKLNILSPLTAVDNSGNGSTDLGIAVTTSSGSSDSVVTSDPSTGLPHRTTIFGVMRNSGVVSAFANASAAIANCTSAGTAHFLGGDFGSGAGISGYVTLTVTVAATLTQVEVYPILSTVTATSDVIGPLTAWNNTATGNVPGYCSGVTADNGVLLSFYPTATGSYTVYFHFDEIIH